jgi:hypothetical protein
MRITLEQFKQYIDYKQSTINGISEQTYDALKALGIDIITLLDKQPQHPLEAVVFSEEQRYWIDWWLYDAPSDNQLVTHPDGSSYNLADVEDLYNYLVEHTEQQS